MIIGIDGNEANVDKRVGIGEYAFELLMQFKKYQVSSIKYQVYLKDEPRKDLPKADDNWEYRVFGPGKLWTQIALPFHLYFKHPRPDVFFSPSHYASRFCPVPTVISIMDLSYIYYPELFRKNDLYQLKNWTAYSAGKAARIFTISKFSRNDIIKEYGVPEERVVVTYPGLKQSFSLLPQIFTMNTIKSKYGISDKYILFVGTLQPRKNIVRLIEAFSKVILERSDRIPSGKRGDPIGLTPSRMTDDLQLVIVGKKGWLYEEILAAPEKFGLSDSVKFLDFVPDEDLPALYKHAECFVLPSLYEGFGLPVLEAMQHGCPVITSNISSLPEAGGDAALYVDPKNVSDIAKKMQMLIEDKKLRRDLIEKGRKQVAKFSWEKTARETLDVLTSVVQEQNA